MSSAAAAGRPTGTVTFLFTDIEGSTALWEQDDSMGVSLAEHDQLLLSTIRNHGGYVFASGGDGFTAAFSDPVAALRAAIETRAGLQLPVRMGLHTGTADERDGNYFGKTLNRAARVMAAGHGGQILMADATASLVCDETRLTDLGVHRLAGLGAPLRLWQVGVEQHPPLRTADEAPSVARRTTPALPVSLFVGRDDDAARVAALLDSCRIVTVCGPGGVGKSRLVRHVAHAVAERYDDGVIWVDFSSIRDPADVPGALAAELRLNALVGATLLARIVEVLAVRQQLVVFDTCEHLVEAVAALVESIGVAADRVDLLLTSREPLRADGEHVLTLAPLDESGAVALLIDRIQSTAPGWVSQAEDVALVAEIAQRVDRLPLALELAAARVPVMGLRGLRDALEQPYEVLYQGRRTATERHRSLTDVVEWSYRLLTSRQRDLFTRLAVFAGQVEWDAIQMVCRGGDEDSPEFSDLADLVDRSLVTVHLGDPTTYGMLDTLRAFARRQLPEPAIGALRSQHCDWALALADDTYAGEVTPHQGSARLRFDAHLAEIRRAHAFLSSSGPGEDLLRLTIVIAHHAYHRLRVDLVRLVYETLSLCAEMRHPLLPRLLGIAANVGWQQGDLDTAEQRCEQAFTLTRVLDDPALGCGAHEAMAAVNLMRGDGDRAHDEAVLGHDLALEAGDLYVQLLALVDLGLTAAYTGDDETAAYYEERIGALAAAVDAPTFLAWDSYLRGERQAERDPAAAVVHSARALELADAVDDRFLAGAARHTMLTTAARTGDPAAALTSFGPLIDHWHASGAWNQLWLALRALIDTLARHGRHRDVAVLLGAYASSPRATPVYGADSSRLEAAAAAARIALGDEFDDLSAEGRAMTDDGAVLMARRLTRSLE